MFPNFLLMDWKGGNGQCGNALRLSMRPPSSESVYPWKSNVGVLNSNMTCVNLDFRLCLWTSRSIYSKHNSRPDWPNPSTTSYHISFISCLCFITGPKATHSRFLNDLPSRQRPNSDLPSFRMVTFRPPPGTNHNCLGFSPCSDAPSDFA